MKVEHTEGLSNRKIALRLRLSREVLGLSQQRFAQRAGLKVPTYNQYETGTNQPSIDGAEAIKRAYHLTLDWIYLGDRSGLPHDLGQQILQRILDAPEPTAD